jgi:hypothetical protein
MVPLVAVGFVEDVQLSWFYPNRKKNGYSNPLVVERIDLRTAGLGFPAWAFVATPPANV